MLGGILFRHILILYIIIKLELHSIREEISTSMLNRNALQLPTTCTICVNVLPGWNFIFTRETGCQFVWSWYKLFVWSLSADNGQPLLKVPDPSVVVLAGSWSQIQAYWDHFMSDTTSISWCWDFQIVVGHHICSLNLSNLICQGCLAEGLDRTDHKFLNLFANSIAAQCIAFSCSHKH